MIVESAILFEGIIHRGRRHYNILGSAKTFGGLKYGKQGFVDDQGIFLTREEAAKVAFECGQIKEEKRILFSEDLY